MYHRPTAHRIDDRERTDDIALSEDVDFKGMLLSQPVLKGLKKAGFVRPSPIQLEAIPKGKCGFDLIIQAKSGTGKTCVFSVIALEMIKPDINSVQVLCIAPTREIAVQVTQVLNAVGSGIKGLEVHSFIGGTPVREDRVKLLNCHIAVGSPGRIKQLIDEKIMKTKNIRLFVLDEADKLLEEESQKDIKAQRLCDVLVKHGWPATYLTGAQEQSVRLRALKNLQNFKCRVLLSTDLSSRGIDAENVNLVLNVDVPKKSATYLHRIGRAGRYGSLGVAITLAAIGVELDNIQANVFDLNLNIKVLPDEWELHDVWQRDFNEWESLEGKERIEEVTEENGEVNKTEENGVTTEEVVVEENGKDIESEDDGEKLKAEVDSIMAGMKDVVLGGNYDETQDFEELMKDYVEEEMKDEAKEIEDEEKDIEQKNDEQTKTEEDKENEEAKQQTRLVHSSMTPGAARLVLKYKKEGFQFNAGVKSSLVNQYGAETVMEALKTGGLEDLVNKQTEERKEESDSESSISSEEVECVESKVKNWQKQVKEKLKGQHYPHTKWRDMKVENQSESSGSESSSEDSEKEAQMQKKQPSPKKSYNKEKSNGGYTKQNMSQKPNGEYAKQNASRKYDYPAQKGHYQTHKSSQNSTSSKSDKHSQHGHHQPQNGHRSSQNGYYQSRDDRHSSRGHYEAQNSHYQSQDGYYQPQNSHYQSQDGHHSSHGQYKLQDGHHSSHGQYKLQDGHHSSHGQYKLQDGHHSSQNGYEQQQMYNPHHSSAYPGNYPYPQAMNPQQMYPQWNQSQYYQHYMKSLDYNRKMQQYMTYWNEMYASTQKQRTDIRKEAFPTTRKNKR